MQALSHEGTLPNVLVIGEMRRHHNRTSRGNTMGASDFSRGFDHAR